MKFYFTLFIFLLVVLILINCKKDNIEKRKLKSINTNSVAPPKNTQHACDTSNLSFSGIIKPLLDSHCAICHAANAGANPVLDNYQNVKNNIQKIINSIRQNGQASPMPKGGSKLDDCSIAKITAWKNNGCPQ